MVDLLAVVATLLLVADQELLSTVEETGAWINLLAGPTFPLVAALLLRVPGAAEAPEVVAGRTRLAWLMLGFGVLGTATLVLHFGAQAALDRGATAGPALSWVSTWLWIGVPNGLLLLLLWFPTGHVPGPRWRWAAWALMGAATAMWLSVALRPGETQDFPGFDNPLGVPGAEPVLAVTAVIGGVLLVGSAIAAVASVVWRFAVGDSDVRAQLRWLVVAVLLITVYLLLPPLPVLHGASIALDVLSVALLPITLAVALVRRDDMRLPRMLVFGLMSALLLGGYLALVGAAHAVFGSSGDGLAALLSAGAVAVAAAPLHGRVQASVDRLVYGDRGDPYAALVELGRRVSATGDDVLGQVVGAVADALRSPNVAVHLGDDPQPTAQYGKPQPALPQVTVPLVLRGRRVGSLVVAQRTRGETFGARDLALLTELGRQVSVAAHATSLTRDLQRSRESLVLAREEERRRIRRDLHDGLGPALAGVAFGIDAARRTLRRDPTGTDSALRELAAEVQGTVADIRRLVYDLRPPALDQLGLVPAVQEYAARLNERGGVTVDVPVVELPDLPAAVEVAAYRIVTEALTNVVRHSGARHSRVGFRVDENLLVIEVADDGQGLPAQRRAGGIGLTAMTERAAELGGTCSATSEGNGGTLVVATLPLRTPATTSTSE
jgi:signal transduction histidine kinase